MNRYGHTPFRKLKREQQNDLKYDVCFYAECIFGAGCLIGKTCIADVAKPLKDNQHVRYVDLSSNGTRFLSCLVLGNLDIPFQV